MNKLTRLLGLFIFLMIFENEVVIAQQPLTLSDAIEAGLRNNYQIQIAEQRMEIARNNNNWKTAGRGPRIDLNIFYNNTFATQNNPFLFIEGKYYNGRLVGNVDAGWTLFDGFKVDINKNRLEELQRQSNSNAFLIVEATIQQIINAYYNALMQQQQLEVYKEVLVISADRARYQKIRSEYGRSSSYDIIQTEDAFLNDSTNLVIQQFKLASAKRNLVLTMGERNLDKEFVLTDKFEFDSTYYDYALLEEKMLLQNKDLHNLNVGRELAAIQTKLAKSDRMPKVSLNGGVNLSGNHARLFGDNPATGEKYDGAWGNTGDLYVNFRGTYNIFDGGYRNRSIENAQTAEMIADMNILDIKRNLTIQLRNIYQDYESQRQLLSITDRLIANAQKNLDLSTERFKAGKLSSFDYRSVQLAYINASQAKLNALFSLKNTETEMIRLVGGLIRE